RKFCHLLPDIIGKSLLEIRLEEPGIAEELESFLEKSWNSLVLKDVTEPIQVLARLPFRRYAKAFPDSLLECALKHETKNPATRIFDWRQARASDSYGFALEEDYKPSIQRPLVSYLFGRFDSPSTLVWSEDNYF